MKFKSCEKYLFPKKNDLLPEIKKLYFLEPVSLTYIPLQSLFLYKLNEQDVTCLVSFLNMSCHTLTLSRVNIATIAILG